MGAVFCSGAINAITQLAVSERPRLRGGHWHIWRSLRNTPRGCKESSAGHKGRAETHEQREAQGRPIKLGERNQMADQMAQDVLVNNERSKDQTLRKTVLLGSIPQ